MGLGWKLGSPASLSRWKRPVTGTSVSWSIIVNQICSPKTVLGIFRAFPHFIPLLLGRASTFFIFAILQKGKSRLREVTPQITRPADDGAMTQIPP